MHSHSNAAQVEAADLEAGLVALLQAQAALSAADARRSSLLRSLDQARHGSLLSTGSALMTPQRSS